MKNGLLWGLVWMVTIGAAFFLGQSMTDEGAQGDEATSDDLALLRQENERLRDELAASGVNAPLLGGRTGAPAGGGPSSSATHAGAGTGTSSAGAPNAFTTFDLVRQSDPDIAIAEFLDYARTMLARGEEGHLALLRTFDAIQRGSKGQAFRRLFGDDFQSSRFLYEVMRFGVRHERQVAALTETVFRTLAEDPDALREFDDDSFEVLTEGIALPMPAIVDRDTMERLRGYARKIVERDKSQLPRSLRDLPRQVKYVLRAWAPMTSLDGAAERISAGDLPLDEATALLRRMSKAQRAGVNIATAAAASLARGDADLLNFFDIGLIVKARDALDPHMLRGVASGQFADHQIRAYLVRTGRGSWDKARPLVERALKLGGTSVGRVLSAAVRLRPAPDSDWVRWALDHHDVSPAVERALRARYKFGD